MDIQTVWNEQAGYCDWVLAPQSFTFWVDQVGVQIVDQNGDPIDAILYPSTGLVEGGDLFTAVLISLMTDAAADNDDIIPDGSQNRRGWWGGSIGSKLWLLSRTKQTPDILALAQGYISDALAWMLADGVVSEIQVTPSFPAPGQLAAIVTIIRGNGTPLSLGFSNLWANI